jgi:hypothetical protein
MLLNDLIALLMQIPPVLASQWAAWFFFGLILSIWTRREKGRTLMHGHTRHDAGVRPVLGLRAPIRTSHTPTAPLSAGDAFSDLEALLKQEVAGTHRPGDAPSLDEPGPAAALATPQSLP